MMALYVLKAQPFDTRLLNVIEILNETTYLICCYFCFPFADFVNDVDLKQKLGWIFLGFIAICISINIASLVISNIITIIKAIKNKLLKLKSKIKAKIDPKQLKDKLSGQINNSFTGLKNNESSFQYEQDHNHNQKTHLDSFARISQNDIVNANFVDDIVNRDDPYSFDSYQSPDKQFSNKSLFNQKIEREFEKHSSVFNKSSAGSYLFRQPQQTTQNWDTQSKLSAGLEIFEPQETNLIKQGPTKTFGPVQTLISNIISDQLYTEDKSQNNINPYNQTSDILQSQFNDSNDETDHQVFESPKSDSGDNEFQVHLQKMQQYINLK